MNPFAVLLDILGWGLVIIVALVLALVIVALVLSIGKTIVGRIRRRPAPPVRLVRDTPKRRAARDT